MTSLQTVNTYFLQMLNDQHNLLRKIFLRWKNTQIWGSSSKVSLDCISLFLLVFFSFCNCIDPLPQLVYEKISIKINGSLHKVHFLSASKLNIKNITLLAE